jgi:hypothetical protein
MHTDCPPQRPPGSPACQQLSLQLHYQPAVFYCLRLQGAKVVQYWRCQHEVFALYGECARWDGLTERLTRYQDDACSVVAEVVEMFARRRDRLRERRSLPLVGGQLGRLRQSERATRGRAGIQLNALHRHSCLPKDADCMHSCTHPLPRHPSLSPPRRRAPPSRCLTAATPLRCATS